MTLRRQLLTSRQKTIDIVSENPLIEQHFENQSNFADVVLTQINTDRFYDMMFEDEQDLTILDIGGNIGLFSLYVQDTAKTVYTLEPTPSHFEILKELTAGYPNIQPLNIALHNCDEEIDFWISKNNSTMNSSVNRYGTKIKVKGKTLATIVKDLGLEHVDFIKCDIEGSEMAAITDETVAAVKDIVDCWFIEIHQTEQGMTWENSLSKNKKIISDIFKRQGYGVQELRFDSLYIYKEADASNT